MATLVTHGMDERWRRFRRTVDGYTEEAVWTLLIAAAWACPRHTAVPIATPRPVTGRLRYAAGRLRMVMARRQACGGPGRAGGWAAPRPGSSPAGA